MLTRVLLVVSLLAAGCAAPQTEPAATADGDLGSIEFPTSGSAEAQPAFLRGVLLLHSFEFDDAAEAFREAQATDAGFAMAYWGEAMTYNHPLWAQVDPQAARAVLERLAPTAEERLAKAGTEKEKDWLRAIDLLYGPGDKLTRDLAYAAQLERMYAAYPDDLEVASFYALALLGTSHEGRDYPTYMRAAAIVEEVFAKNAQHPGAAHYLIHSYDDPVHAPLGVRAADAYSRIAPSASHALHMPSHIYFALGDWEKAAALNERSAQAADERVARKGLGVDDRGFHALQWLEYAYLQAGRYDDAASVLETVEANAAASGSPRTRSHLALMRAAWLVETRRWDDRRPAVAPESLGADAVAADRFARGYAAASDGDVPGAHDILAAMRGDGHAAPPSADMHEGMAMSGLPAAGSGGGAGAPAIMALQLEAAIAQAEGRMDDAVRLALEAAAAEDALSFEFGPPVPVKPAHELAGDILLAAGRAGEARAEFEAALERAPGRTLSLLGLAEASAAAGDRAAADQAMAAVRANRVRADAGIEEVTAVSANDAR